MLWLLLLIPVASFGWLLWSILRSPLGYEDETGFHLGVKGKEKK